MKAILLFLAFFIISYWSLGQSKTEVVIPKYNDKYTEFIKKLESGQTDINYREFRESFIESEQFKSAKTVSFDSLKKELYANIAKKDYQAIIVVAKQMLSIDYTSMRAHKALQQTYKVLGDTVNRKKYHDIEFGLLNSIVKSGDGKTCETGWPVVQVSEEYFILDMLRAEMNKQSLVDKNGLCDKMEVKTNKGKKTYFF